eukprot:CAMPEP_0181117942 /NCGR_PEP_ID=MMETSP1071-20121207/22806_1 /TAXON_ID=35127 /ORGANISM="Thalassiosira sp., Strain NH16" /LENGTH=887 /DNA_ID=CAMNT_0023202393 /DNA_START=104 /DNA_END=2767 /DNA_ORIENTATION=+
MAASETWSVASSAVVDTRSEPAMYFASRYEADKVVDNNSRVPDGAASSSSSNSNSSSSASAAAGGGAGSVGSTDGPPPQSSEEDLRREVMRLRRQLDELSNNNNNASSSSSSSRSPEKATVADNFIGVVDVAGAQQSPLEAKLSGPQAGSTRVAVAHVVPKKSFHSVAGESALTTASTKERLAKLEQILLSLHPLALGSISGGPPQAAEQPSPSRKAPPPPSKKTRAPSWSSASASSVKDSKSSFATPAPLPAADSGRSGPPTLSPSTTHTTYKNDGGGGAQRNSDDNNNNKNSLAIVPASSSRQRPGLDPPSSGAGAFGSSGHAQEVEGPTYGDPPEVVSSVSGHSRTAASPSASPRKSRTTTSSRTMAPSSSSRRSAASSTSSSQYSPSTASSSQYSKSTATSSKQSSRSNRRRRRSAPAANSDNNHQLAVLNEEEEDESEYVAREERSTALSSQLSSSDSSSSSDGTGSRSGSKGIGMTSAVARALAIRSTKDDPSRRSSDTRTTSSMGEDEEDMTDAKEARALVARDEYGGVESLDPDGGSRGQLVARNESCHYLAKAVDNYGAVVPIDSAIYEAYDHTFVTCPESLRFRFLFTFLKKNLDKKVMIFFSTTNSAKYHAKLLGRLNVPTMTMHGNQRREKFIARFFEFSDKDEGILCATDAAGRDLDVPPSVDWVVQFEPPDDPSEYILRVARISCDGDRIGRSLLFLNPGEHGFLKYYHSASIPVSEFEIPRSLVDVQANIEHQVDESDRLLRLARDAYGSYLIAYASHDFRDVYNVHDLNKADVATAFGLVGGEGPDASDSITAETDTLAYSGPGGAELGGDLGGKSGGDGRSGNGGSNAGKTWEKKEKPKSKTWMRDREKTWPHSQIKVHPKFKQQQGGER